MPKEMLINVSEGEECRIALVDDGRLEELYMERSSSAMHVGNIYKGRVTNVEASIQAAFIDFGLGRNGFLHITDLMPTYFGRQGEDIQESVGRKMARRDRPPIQRCLRRGDEIVVQVIKEGIGTKGPTLSSYLSIPGRILVMMPGMSKMGVSKKIEDDEERRRLRQILDGLKPPKDVGFIIRTAGVGKSKAEIQRDFTYLSRLWMQIEKQRDGGPGPMELYTEGDLVTRTVRDVFTSDVERIVVDNEEVAKRVKDVIKITAPRTKNRVEFYDEPTPLFHKYDIEKDIEQMYSRHVPLPSGGSLVIDSTEAIVAIDVNSGKMREHGDAETTAFKTDMEAADEIPRQLRLRDLGGVIICDFIDLRYERHRRELEERLHDHFKDDRAKTKVLRMSQFGIIEMTRQRMRPSLKRSIYCDCPHCKGAGLIKTPESMSLDVMRRLQIAIYDQRVQRVELIVHPEVAFYLQNRKRASLANLEDDTRKHVLVRTDEGLGLDEVRLELYDVRDGRVYLSELGMLPEQPGRPGQGPPQHARGGPPPRQQSGRHDRGGGGRRPPAPPVRRREAEPEEEPFDLDRGEDAVDEREETLEHERPDPSRRGQAAAAAREVEREPDQDEPERGEDAGEVGRDNRGNQRHEPRRDQGRGQRGDQRGDQQRGPRGDGRRDQGRNDQRNDNRNDRRDGGGRGGRGDEGPSSYTNFTDNDVDLGDEEDDQPPPRREDRRDDRRDQRPAPQQNQPPRRDDRRPDDRQGGGRPPQQQGDRQQPQPNRGGGGQPQPQGYGQGQGGPQGGGQPGQPGEGEGLPGEGGHRRRRRRRRGGRGRNRNREGQGFGPGNEGGEFANVDANGQPLPAGQEDVGERDEDERDERDERAQGQFGPRGEDAREDAREDVGEEVDEMAEIASEIAAEAIGEAPRPIEDDAAEAGDEADAPPADVVADEVTSDVEPAAEAQEKAPAKGRRRGSRGGAKSRRGKKAAAAEAPAAPAEEPAAPEEKPAAAKRGRGSRGGGRGGATGGGGRKTRTAKTSEPPRGGGAATADAPAPVADESTVARTGSSDRHQLIVDEVEDDEPIVPAPTRPSRRPPTFRDLDAIPDDFD